jgi:hypothetical protein
MVIASCRQIWYNDAMGKDVLAIKWGAGHRLLKEPYINKEDTWFVYGCLPPNNTKVVNTQEACFIIGEYLNAHNINVYQLKIGMMAFVLEGNRVFLRTSYNGKVGLNVKAETKPRRKRSNAPRITKYLASTNSIDKNWLMEVTNELRGIAKRISQNIGVSEQVVWNKLYNCNDLVYMPGREGNKLRIMAHYSNGDIKCRRCGLTDIRALSIDHMNGGGGKHIRAIKGQGLGSNFYNWLIKNNYPDGFQVLCMSCQWVKRAENNECARPKCPSSDAIISKPPL